MPGPFPSTATVTRFADVFERRCGDVVVVLRHGAGEVRRLEGPAAAVWTVAASPIRIGDLVAGACDAAGTDVDPERVATNVTDAVAALERAGLVEVATVSGPTGAGEGRG